MGNKPTIALGLSYLNNETEIPRSIEPWLESGVIDIVVGVNGRFKGPLAPKTMTSGNVPPKFSTDNSELILENIVKKYPDVGLVNEKFFGTQVEKRQRMFDLSSEVGTDVLIVWDTDDIVRKDYYNPDMFLNNLKRFYQPTIPEVFGLYIWLPDRETYARQHNEVKENIWMKYGRIHTNPGLQRYALNHYTFTRRTVEDDIIIAHDIQHPTDYFNCPELHPFILWQMIGIDGIRGTTDRKFRTDSQIEFGTDWAYQNMKEEMYRVYLHDMRLSGYTEENINPIEYRYYRDGPLKGKERPRNRLYRELGTYYFDEDNAGYLTEYTPEQAKMWKELN